MDKAPYKPDLKNHREKKHPPMRKLLIGGKKADQISPLLTLTTKGPTDAGFPLHLAILSSKGYNSIHIAREAGATIILVNNGIHPGEPDGIDASMLLAKKSN